MRKQMFLVLLLLGMVILLLVGVVFASTEDGFDLNRNVLAGGGGKMSGGSFEISGTVGQNVIGTSSTSGFTVNQGFWYQLSSENWTFLPLTIKH